MLLFCVASYFILMGILTIYTSYIEKGIFVVAASKDSHGKDSCRWEASSSLKKYDDQYELLISYYDISSGKVREAKSKRSVAQYFDNDGVLLMDLVEPEVTKLHNSLLTGRKAQ